MKKCILIILVLLAFCCLQEVSAGNLTDNITCSTHFSSNITVNNFNVGNSSIIHVDDVDVNVNEMNYNECMNYLLKGNTPTYILVDGDVSNLNICSYIPTEHYPSNYHSLSNNYHNISLNDSSLEGTLLYCPHDYELATTFLTSSSNNIGLIEYCLFNRALRDTQYINMNQISIPAFNDSIAEKIKNIIDTDRINGPKRVGLLIDSIIAQMNNTINNYLIEVNKVYTHNLVVSNARGDTSGRYWGMGHYHEFANIDDNTLDILNIYNQDCKIAAKTAVLTVENIILIYDTIILALEYAKTAVPSDYGMDKPISLAILAVKSIQIDLKYYKNSLDKTYVQFDSMTWKISSEKSYRALIRNGVVAVNPFTSEEVKEYNAQVDEQIYNLTVLKNQTYDRIYSPTVESIQASALDNMSFIKNQEEWIFNDGFGTSFLFDSSYKLLEDANNSFEEIYNNATDTIAKLNLEKQIYASFCVEIDNMIRVLQSQKLS